MALSNGPPTGAYCTCIQASYQGIYQTSRAMETGQSRGQRSLSHLGSAGQPGTANPRAPPRAHRLTANRTLIRATAAADADRPGRSSQALEDQEVAGALLREVDVEGERHQLPSLLTKVTEMFQEKEAIQPPVCARQIPYVHRVFDLRHGVPPPGSSVGWTPPLS